MRLDLAIKQGSERLEARRRGDVRLDAEMLMMHVLGRDKAYLYTHPELELGCRELSRYDEALQRRLCGEPVQYITGHQEFWGLDLVVTPAVLIPRPETEHAVEAALELLRWVDSPSIVDVGTGSGCIALALASELPEATISAVDISDEALNVARQNATRLGFADRISFSQSDLLAKYLDSVPAFDLVISNPPYVGESEEDQVQLEVRKFEPRNAVFAGPTGVEVIERLVPAAQDVLRPGGWLAFEISGTIAEAVRKLLRGWNEVHVVNDLQGIARVVIAKRG